MNKVLRILAIAGALTIGLTGCSIDAEALRGDIIESLETSPAEEFSMIRITPDIRAYEWTFPDGTPVKCFERLGDMQCDFGDTPGKNGAQE